MYKILREKALKTAEEIGIPAFYRNYRREVEKSAVAFSQSSVLQKCLSYLDESVMHPAHGIPHCTKVAIDAGAILSIECREKTGYDVSVGDLILSVQIAGLFHDIKRNEDNHTVKGSIEAAKILEDFDLDKSLKRYITAAIHNHEAFKPVLKSENKAAELISDSLYDADKFRWGPDNFTTTLWLMVESSGTSAEMLYHTFREKLPGIKKIKETFRTTTGKKYGPEFIDLGLAIGDKIYQEMGVLIGC